MLTPYYDKNNVTIYNGDCLSCLKELPNESIDMVMTSPPYYALRDYEVEEQLGLERKAIGIDLSKNYCDLAIKRLESLIIEPELRFEEVV